ncbi:hypothetical protein [Streptomyces anulatus]|uniref:hypothetical protein n=1 Tax=Streptomyces anulatus TaxID=1892 RepID=UPI002E2FAD39|nr:hypothetical protein [Streptomyces anulatus]WTD27590.1 hypothetical protein OH737_25115 [Streptomyces anulatus]
MTAASHHRRLGAERLPAAVYDVGGLRVHLLDTPTHTSGCVLTVGIGCAHDDGVPAGTAHFTEHVRIAAGSPVADAPVLPAVRGHTDTTRTRFSAVSLAEDTVGLGRLMASLLDTRGVTPSGFEAEKEAVLVEMSASADAPFTRLGPTLAEAACPGRGLGTTLLADRSSLARVTAEDVAETARTGYRRDRAELALVGPGLPVDELLAAIDRAAAPLGVPAPAVPVPVPVPLSSLRIPEHDGIVAVTWVRFEEEPEPHDALMGSRGLAEASVAALGHPVLGRTTVRGSGVQVDVLCWRAGDAAEDLARALAAERDALLSEARSPEALRRAALRRFQNTAYASATPLGAAARLLDGTGAAPSSGPSRDGAPPPPRHTAPERFGVWQVRGAVPCRVA